MMFLIAVTILVSLFLILMELDPVSQLQRAYRRHRGVRRFVRRLPVRIQLAAMTPVMGAAGELTIADWTAQNKANNNLQPYTCVDIDAANTNITDTAVVPVTAAGAELIGICYDKSRLDPSGAVIKNSGVTVRTYGFARVIASAAIAAGAYVSTTAAGQIQTQAKAAAGVQLVPIVGRALTQATAANDRPVVALMIGARV